MIKQSTCDKRDCEHYQGVNKANPDDESTEFHYCRAYPEGIPDDISFGNKRHLQSYGDDSGIIFKKRVNE